MNPAAESALGWGAEALWIGLGLLALLAGGAALLLRGRPGRGRGLDEGGAYLRGVRHLISDDPDAAIEELTRVVRVNTEAVETYFALGALFRRKGEFDRAIRIHQNLMARPDLAISDRTRARFELAFDYRHAGMLEQAAQGFEEVAAGAGRAPGLMAEALAQLRDIHLDSGDYAEAVSAQKRRMKVTDGDERALLAHLLAAFARKAGAAGEADDAKRALREAEKHHPEGADVALAFAEHEIRAGRHKAAKKRLDAALSAEPALAVSAAAVVDELFFSQGRFQEVEAYWGAQIARAPSEAFFHLALALHLQRRGREDEAIEAAQEALRSDPRLHQAKQLLARLLLDARVEEGLRPQLEEAFQGLSPVPDFHCQGCGHASSAFVWRCPRCGAWDQLARAGAPEKVEAAGAEPWPPGLGPGVAAPLGLEPSRPIPVAPDEAPRTQGLTRPDPEA